MKETKQSQLQSLKVSSFVFALLQGSFSHLSDYDPLPVGHCRGSSFRGVDGNHRADRFMTLLRHLVCEGRSAATLPLSTMETTTKVSNKKVHVSK